MICKTLAIIYLQHSLVRLLYIQNNVFGIIRTSTLNIPLKHASLTLNRKQNRRLSEHEIQI